MAPTTRLDVLDLGVTWDAGAPMPQLLAGAGTAIVLCYGDMASRKAEEGDLVEIRFDGCQSVRIGHPNDEVLHGHPLWGRGMHFYEAHLVHASPLLLEHRRINSHHEHHSDATWDRLNHYFLAFHDEVVEALASGISARRVSGSMASELARAAAELARHA